MIRVADSQPIPTATLAAELETHTTEVERIDALRGVIRRLEAGEIDLPKK